MSDLLMRRSAVISDCGIYRYSLSREWGEGAMMAFIMLNPSTADAFDDDPTIRRCIGFAKREGMGSMRVVNVFGLRATNPENLWVSDDPMGPVNWIHVGEAMDAAETIVCAWGAHPRAAPHAYAINQLAGSMRMVCLGKTKGGHPRHPLYLPAAQPFEAYP